MGDNIGFGSKNSYPTMTKNLNREILDWLKNQITGPPGDKGLKGDEGDKGNPGTAADPLEAQYSVDGASWHTTYTSADLYLRFSADGGISYGPTIRIVGDKGDKGDNANAVLIQYSTNNSDWFNTPQTPTNYIRFSLDNGSTWETSFECRGSAGDDGDNGDNAPIMQIEFSINGSTSWHGTFVVGVDKYIRIAVDGASTWVMTERIVGIDGADGANAYVYIAYADSAIGTGFTNTYASDKDYVAILVTTTEISTPVVGDFTGLWKGWLGPAGDDGQNAFIDIAYASAIDGTGFTLTNDDALDYMAILNSTVYIPTPLVVNFAGLWFKRRGASGTNASWIQLPTGATVTARCAGILEQPVGWTMDAGNVISNPLSSSGVDLVINHGQEKKVIGVTIKKKISDRQQKLIGVNEFSGWEDDIDGNFLSILSITEELATIDIYILFET